MVNTALTVRINAVRAEARRTGLTLQVMNGGKYAFFTDWGDDSDIFLAQSIREAEAFAAGIHHALR